jgi:S-formylglutathione hydrolase FrmB
MISLRAVTLLTVILSAAVPRAAVAQSALRIDTLFSPSLQRMTVCSILVPDASDTTVAYPVLYLLHGYSGNHLDWFTRTRLNDDVRGWPLLVVMPAAENSWYVNARMNGKNRYEDFLMVDLPRHVRQHYRVDTLRQGIAGLSMGGYGAIMLALRHPGRFCFAGSLSGALVVPRDIDEIAKATWGRSIAPSVLEAFGTEADSFRDHHDVFRLFRAAADSGAPFLYFATGIQDAFPTFLSAHRELTDSLRSVGALYEYHEVPGNHSWGFWDAELPNLLQRFRAVAGF